MTQVHGHVDERFAGVRQALEERLETGEEIGAAIHVDLDGEPVVDLWGGHRDEARTEPWVEDTIVNVWSTTKTVTSLAALVLVSRGQLDVHAPVARYWPEFAQNGKEGVLVRHLMAHTSGVSGWEQPFTLEQVYDWEAATAHLAAQAPWWEPGTASGYHALNQGHLVGEVIRRIDGRPLKQFVAEEIAGPLGADFQIGAREEDWPRIAPVVPLPPPDPASVPAMDPDGVPARTFAGIGAPGMALTPGWRLADIGAANGHGTARGIARISSVVSRGGEVDGVRLLTPKAIELAFEEQSNGIDLALGIPLRFGIGYALPQPGVHPNAPVPDGRILYWGGAGGSSIVMDVGRRMTFCYVMNKMGEGTIGNPRTGVYMAAAYRALGVEVGVTAPV